MSAVRPGGLPAPLLVSASLVAVEGLLFLLYGVAVLASTSVEWASVAIASGAFFTGWGAGLLLLARELGRGRAWTRSPVVLAQLLHLGVAWNFRAGDTTWMAVVGAGVAVLALVGIFHPASIEALAEE